MRSLRGKPLAFTPEQATSGVFRAEIAFNAIAGQCKGAIREGNGLVDEGVRVEVGVVRSVFVESSRGFGLIGGSPVVVVAGIALVREELLSLDHLS